MSYGGSWTNDGTKLSNTFEVKYDGVALNTQQLNELLGDPNNFSFELIKDGGSSESSPSIDSYDYVLDPDNGTVHQLNVNLSAAMASGDTLKLTFNFKDTSYTIVANLATKDQYYDVDTNQNDDKLYKVVGKVGSTKIRTFVKTLDSTKDKVVSSQDELKTIIEGFETDTDVAYTVIVTGTTPYHIEASTVSSFPKNLTILGCEGAKFSNINLDNETKLPTTKFVLESLTFDANNDEANHWFGVRASHSVSEFGDFEVKNCKFINHAVLCLRSVSTANQYTVDKLLVDNCTFNSSGSLNYMIYPSYTHVTDLEVTNCIFDSPLYDVVQMGGTQDKLNTVKIENNVVTNLGANQTSSYGRGFNIACSSQPSSVSIKNNTISTVSGWNRSDNALFKIGGSLTGEISSVTFTNNTYMGKTISLTYVSTTASDGWYKGAKPE